MAYSNYGAFIWKNGKNVTKQYADIDYVWKKDKFRKNAYSKKDDIVAGGHAVLCFGDFCIEFYKILEPKLVFSSGKTRRLSVLDNVIYNNKKLGLKIVAYSLDYYKCINQFEIYYKKDNYCVICGSCVGNGYDDNNVSQYILKHMLYNKEQKNYYIDNPIGDPMVAIEKMSRLDEIADNKYWIKKYTKMFWADLFKFNFKNVIWDIDQIKDYREKIKWLK